MTSALRSVGVVRGRRGECPRGLGVGDASSSRRRACTRPRAPPRSGRRPVTSRVRCPPRCPAAPFAPRPSAPLPAPRPGDRRAAPGPRRGGGAPRRAAPRPPPRRAGRSARSQASAPPRSRRRRSGCRRSPPPRGRAPRAAAPARPAAGPRRVAQGAGIQVERLSMGGDRGGRRRPPGAPPRTPRRACPARSSWSDRNASGKSPRGRRDLGDAGMEPAPLGVGDAGIDRVADERVPEPVAPDAGDAREQEVVGQLRERRVERARPRHADDRRPAGRTRTSARSPTRSGPPTGPRARAQPEPAKDRGLERVGHVLRGRGQRSRSRSPRAGRSAPRRGAGCRRSGRGSRPRCRAARAPAASSSEAIVAVSSRSSRRRRASSACRWASSRARHWRIGTRG